MKTSPDDYSPAELSLLLHTDVVAVHAGPPIGANWSRHWPLQVDLRDGTRRSLRLKVVEGSTFDNSEVDYYLRDYVDMPDAPLVRCHDAAYSPGQGYHVLMDDLSTTHAERRDVEETAGYAEALAQALGRLHAHHWRSRGQPPADDLERFLAAVRPGLPALASATGRPDLPAHWADTEARWRRRWQHPAGMTLLHGDLNPTNILTPRGADSPPIFLDRQPFDWSLTYGPALLDLAYATVLWFPPEIFQARQALLLETWYAALARPDYSWEEVLADWPLAIALCLSTPMERCIDAADMASAEWLWQNHTRRVCAALGW